MLILIAVFFFINRSHEQTIKSVAFYPNTSLHVGDAINSVGNQLPANGLIKLTLTDGRTGSLCNLGFNSIGASIACSMMGYPAVGISLQSKMKALEAPILVSLICSESVLNSVSASSRHLSRCSQPSPNLPLPPGCKEHLYDAHVMCLQPKPLPATTMTPSSNENAANSLLSSSVTCTVFDNSVRLRDGGGAANDNKGRLEVRNAADNRWYSVCGTFNTCTAQMALTFCKWMCKNVTFANVVLFKYPSGSGPIGLRDLSCPNTAKSLTDCSVVPNSGSGSSDAASNTMWSGVGCNRESVVGLECDRVVTEGENSKGAGVSLSRHIQKLAEIVQT